MVETDFMTKVRDKLREIEIKQRDLDSQLAALQEERGRYEGAMSVWAKEMENGSKAAAQAPADVLYDKRDAFTVR